MFKIATNTENDAGNEYIVVILPRESAQGCKVLQKTQWKPVPSV
jgi:hypothetical protein